MTDPIDTTHPVHDILTRLMALGEAPEVSVAQMVTGFGSASFVPALMVPALLVVSPLSGIPLFSTVCGITITLISLQILLRRDHLWLPGMMMRRHINGARLRTALARIRPAGDWLDRRTHLRLGLLFRPPLSVLPQLACVACGAAMPFLELIPFSSSLLGAAVTCFAVAFLARDGVFVVAGLAFMGTASVIPLTVLSQIT